MPELPEVRVVVSQLKKFVLQKNICDIEIFTPSLIKEIDNNVFKKQLINHKILDIQNVGKNIVFFLSDNVVMISHLRMEGKYNFYSTKNKGLHNDRIFFNFSDGTQLHYNDSRMFGTFHIRNNNNYLNIAPLNKIAPTPHNLDINLFYSKLIKSKKHIKTFLLDQSNVAGLGNIYVNEVLFETKIHPEIITNKITFEQCKAIVIAAIRILDASEKLGGSSIHSYTSLNHEEGTFQNFLKVHSKDKQLCSQCNQKIDKIKVNGRGTYYCPNCQRKDL